RRVVHLALVLGALGLVVAPVAVQAANAVNDTFPFTATTSNPCNGEPVVLEGGTHVVVHQTFDSSGGTHLDVDTNVHASGTGLATGVKYEMNGTDKQSGNLNSGATEFASISHLRVVSQTGAVP